MKKKTDQQGSLKKKNPKSGRSGAGKPAGSTARSGGGKTAPRKTAAGKAATGKSADGDTASAQRKRLEGQLKEAIAQIDEEGLLFLLQQAQVLIHNAQVEKINREIEELQQRTAAAGRGAQGKRRGAAAGTSAAGRSAGGRFGAVRIDEAADRGSFFLELNRTRKALSLPEMQRVVKICYAAESKSDALRQLYTFFARERGDILADARIEGPASPILDELFYAVREKYRLEER
jgi:hypothetical protein